MGGWRWTGVVATALVALSVPAYLVRRSAQLEGAETIEPTAATFVGRESCVSCHQEAFEAWSGSDHDLAMDHAGEDTVRGDFDDAVFEHGGVDSRFFRRDGKYLVYTEGPGGEMEEFEIAYTFGHEPLQQYLVPFPGGRLQALSLAWDTERGEWFHLYPDVDIPPEDWLHWTRNAQNWNGMCAECHSTHLEKGYDADSDTYETTWSEIDVSCEACHGPGSRHVEWAEIEPMARPPIEQYGLIVATRELDARTQVELCAPCHSRRSERGDYDHRRVELMDTLVPAVLDEGLYHPDGQILDEVYVYGSFLQSKMYRNGVKCSDCHDVHSLRLRFEGNDLCLQCHRDSDFDRYEHHFHQEVFEGKPSAAVLCVSCHMPQRNYMVVDPRADHSLRIPRPDLTLEIGVPNACGQGGCHDDRPVSWLADAYRDWYGRARKPHYGPVLAAGREGRPEAEGDLVRLAADPLVAAIVRATALQLLRSYPGAESHTAHLAGLVDEEPLVRYTAVGGVAPVGPEELAEVVAPLLFDSVRAVRLLAATRLAGIPDAVLAPYQREALAAALADHEAAMTSSLDFSSSGHNLGNLYTQLGNRSKAESFYRKAIAVDDLFYPAKVNLAYLYNAEGRNEEAEALLREVLDDYPELADVAYSLGLLLAEEGRFPAAAEALRQATEGAPDVARFQYNFGLVSQQLGQMATARVALTQAVGLEPGNLRYLHALADHLLRAGEPEAALPVAEQMMAIAPEEPLAQQVRSLVEAALRARGGG